jgi:aspartate-semialdehyde dehydrogenase
MIRSRGDSVRTDTRIALIGAQSPEGQRVKRVLETLQVDGERVNLFGACAGDAALSDYDGAARLIQEADRAAIDGHGLVFLCETDSFTERFLNDPGPASVALDLTGVGYQNKSIDLVHDRLKPPPEGVSSGLWAVPDSLALVLIEILQPIAEHAGLEEATAILLRPASDFGDAAVDELREQTSQLLAFGSPTTEIFGQNLAFNAIPDRLMKNKASNSSGRIVREAAALLGMARERLFLEMVVLPMFFGHGVMMQVRTTATVSVEELYKALGAGEGIQAASDDGECTPQGVEGRGGISVSLIRKVEDNPRAFWLWAAVDDAESRAAVQAVRLARHAGAL